MTKDLDGQEYLAKMEADLAAEGDKFFAALGRAISAWSSVESHLYELFLLCMGLEDDDTASVAYHSVISFNARWQMVGKSFNLRYGKTKFHAGWPKLHERIGKKAGQRNKLAHFDVVSFFQGETGRRFYLTPVIRDASNRPSISGRPRQMLYLSDLVAIGEEFRALAQEMGSLWLRVHHEQGTGPFDPRNASVSDVVKQVESREQLVSK